MPEVAPAARVQLLAGVKVPVELVEKLTNPVGVVGAPDVSVTVPVQLVPWFKTRDDGEQVMLVLVVLGVLAVIPRLKLLELPE